mmetsp:Transcript_67518/g.161478  ORF Transcript_67518/g.161478 Transcript_67518/m.161478 type:complete len:200 (+) Transcript_67518:1228-1827(+)
MLRGLRGPRRRPMPRVRCRHVQTRCRRGQGVHGRHSGRYLCGRRGGVQRRVGSPGRDQRRRRVRGRLGDVRLAGSRSRRRADRRGVHRQTARGNLLRHARVGSGVLLEMLAAVPGADGWVQRHLRLRAVRGRLHHHQVRRVHGLRGANARHRRDGHRFMDQHGGQHQRGIRQGDESVARGRGRAVLQERVHVVRRRHLL